MEPTLIADERTQLEEFLETNRDELVETLDGLDEEQARRRLVPSLTTLLGLVTGIATGLINGALVTRLSLPPFIVTLGTLNIFLALTLLYSGGATVRGGEMPELLTWTGATFPVFGVNFTVGVVMMLLLYVAIAFILPFSPVSSALGFAAPPPSYFIFVIGVVTVYLTVVEMAKQIVFRKL